jgi:hypothetical protein
MYTRYSIYLDKTSFLFDGTDEFTDGKWEWVSNAEPFDFTNWAPNEPNGGTREYCLMPDDKREVIRQIKNNFLLRTYISNTTFLLCT